MEKPLKEDMQNHLCQEIGKQNTRPEISNWTLSPTCAMTKLLTGMFPPNIIPCRQSVLPLKFYRRIARAGLKNGSMLLQSMLPCLWKGGAKYLFPKVNLLSLPDSEH